MAASMARLEWLNVSNSSMYTVRPAKGLVQAFGRQFHAVAGVHGCLGQQGFIGSKNQGQFPQLIFVRTGGVGIIRQGLRADARAFSSLMVSAAFWQNAALRRWRL